MNYTEEDYIVEKIKGKVGTTVTFANGEKVVVTLPYEQWKSRKELCDSFRTHIQSLIDNGTKVRVGF